MKFRCERDVLVDALSTVGRAVSQRPSLPSLAGILFEAKGDSLRLTGTDLDMSTQLRIPVASVDEGRAVIPSKLAIDIVKELPPGAVSFEVDEGEARISGGRASFVVRTLSSEDFPAVTTAGEFQTSLASEDLAGALRQIVRAASSDDTRPVLTGVLLTTHEGRLRLVATDSYRLAVRGIDVSSILGDTQSVLVPSRTLTELARLMNDTEHVQVALADKELSVAVGTVVLTSRLIEGQFPSYESLIPKSYPNRLQMDRASLLESVKRVKLLARDTTTPVRVALYSDHIQLTVISQEIGKATEEVEAKYEGEEMTVAFNPTYLIDGLDSIQGDNAVIKMIDALKPATLKAENDNDFLYLIMPVRVS